MLLTVTMNPSVDISYRLDEFILDDVNRTNEVSKTAGGKGLNVARVASQTGLQVGATGLMGGYLGDFIKDNLETDDIHDDFFYIDQESRNCIAIIHDGKQTEILEDGPDISEKEGVAFIKHFEKILQRGQYRLIAISGSLPRGMKADVYQKMIHMANEVGIPVLLDTSGRNLSNILDDENLQLKAIKPNIDELNAIEDEAVTKDVNSLINILSGDRYSRCEWVLVSLGGDGSLIKYKDDYYRLKVPKIEVINATGSGDSTVAGMAYGILKDMTAEEIMKSAMTTGVLNTMNEKTGSIDQERFSEIFQQISVVKL